MKNRKETFCLTLTVLLCCTNGICGLLDFEKAVDYKQPQSFYDPSPLTSNGDDPFSGDGLGFECLSIDQCSSVIFQLGAVGFRIGEGKNIKSSSASPPDVKSELEFEWKEKVTKVTPATIGELNGFTTFSLTAFGSADMGPSFYKVCWIQIETNTFLKVTAVSCDATIFKSLTNSLLALKIDKSRLLASLEPGKPEITTQRLEKVTVGYIPGRSLKGQFIAAYIFQGQRQTIAFTAMGGVPTDLDNSPAKWLQKLCDFSKRKDSLRMAVFEIGENQVSLGYDERTCGFIAETNAAAIELAKKNDFLCPTALRILSWQENGYLDGFQKIAEYKMDAILFIRKRQINY